MAYSMSTLVAITVISVLILAHPAAAFGAGNIASLSRIEGQNFRHGDIEDVLLSLLMARSAGGRKFSKLDLQRVYFGNWLRDYSQAVDVGTVKYVSAEAIRILVWVLGFMSFGYGTGEFEVTTERLGCYQPTEHIDNPLGYAEGEDARQYDRRLRGPLDEQLELAIDPRTGLKNYIASEDAGIATSAGFVRDVFGRCIELGRSYARTGDKTELYEAFRLLGTGLHCLEDYAAHSNYTELSLFELGEQGVFPHVGRNVMIELPGAQHPVYPIVTGTFGGVDFLHSVMGEVSDKATQSEIQTLEGVVSESQHEGPSRNFLQELLNNIPAGVFGDSDNSDKMQEFQSNAQEAKERESISPREPEEWTRYLDDVQRQIYPVLEWHDTTMQSISEAIEQMPVLPELMEQITDQINLFVFSILAPYVLPIINQVKAELETGSSEIIQSSKDKQHNIFNDDYCSDPTHSMLSKDHFSNILNGPAGKIAQEVVKWVVPQIMECWDDDYVDVDRTVNRIVSGVFHHPNQRDIGDDGAVDVRQIMFQVVEEWWDEQGNSSRDALRQQLSAEGVMRGENHKPGVHDCGHGNGKPLSLPNNSKKEPGFGRSDSGGLGKIAQEAVGGGALGGLVGGFLDGATSGLFTGSSGDVDRDRAREQNHDDDDDKYERENKRHDRNRSQDFPGYSRAEVTYGGNATHESYESREDFTERRNHATGYGPPIERVEGSWNYSESHGGYGGEQEHHVSYRASYREEDRRSRSRSRSHSRESRRRSSRHYKSRHHGHDERRHSSQEREYEHHESYQRHYKKESSGSDSDSKHYHYKHYHHGHHRKSSSDS